MERIELNYYFSDENGEEKHISSSKRDEDGLHDYEVCEIFQEFMRSIGFSETNVIRYFQE